VYRKYGCRAKMVLEKKKWMTKMMISTAKFKSKNTDRMPKTFPRKYSTFEKERVKTA
jgi:hypothetical protein